MSKGLLDDEAGLVVFCGKLKPEAVVAGVSDLGADAVLSRGDVSEIGDRAPPSPSRTSASTVLSRFPLTPFRTMEFRWSSVKPMSWSWASFLSMSSEFSYCTLAPKPFDDLFRRGDPGLIFDKSRGEGRGRVAASLFALDDRGNIDEADLKPNLLGVLGGRGGGVSSDSVLPVLWRR